MTNRLLWLMCALTCGWMEGQVGAPRSSGQETPKAQQLPLSGRSQNGNVAPNETPTTAGGANSVNKLNPSLQIEGAYQGSVSTGTAGAQSLGLTLQDAVKRGVQYNPRHDWRW